MSIAQKVMGEVTEENWTCIAASHEDDEGYEIVDEAKIGERTITRRVYFAYRAEAEAWLREQEAEGFAPGMCGGIMSAATFYHGPTDAPGNCWSVSVERVR